MVPDAAVLRIPALPAVGYNLHLAGSRKKDIQTGILPVVHDHRTGRLSGHTPRLHLPARGRKPEHADTVAQPTAACNRSGYMVAFMAPSRHRHSMVQHHCRVADAYGMAFPGAVGQSGILPPDGSHAGYGRDLRNISTANQL